MESDPIIDQKEKVSIWTKISHPKYSAHRYIALMFMSLMGFGNYFVYDIPGALQEKITRDMSVSTAEFSLLYSWYSWPNVVLCFFGGYLTDKVFGIRLGSVLFCIIIVIGQFLIVLGSFLNHFWLMEFGRFVFGIGGESLAVAQNTYAVTWFDKTELNMVFGFQLSFSRLGSSASFYTMKPIYDYVNRFVEGHICLSIVFAIASLTCVFSLLSSIILAFLDKRCEKLLNRVRNVSDEKVNFTDVKHFGLNFWLLALICVMYYLTVFPFVGLATVYIKRKYDLTEETANSVDSCVYIVAAFISPFCGFLVDKTGRNIFWVLFGIVLTNIAHFIIAFTQFSPWICTTLMGFGYSILASALWPMVSLIVPHHQLNTAYGMMQALQNLGLGLASIMAGIIVEYKGYIMLESVFLLSLSLTLILTVFSLIIDMRNGSILNMSYKERLKLQKLKNDETASNASVF